VVVTINDRIPRRDRVIDVSRGAARALGLIGPGIGRVRLEVVREAPPRERRVKRASGRM
jgi:rare lipoprotein A